MKARRAARLLVAAMLVPLAGAIGPRAMAAPGAVVVSHGPRTERAVALTFDDGADPANCRRILAELVAAGVPATFFPIATAMSLDPAFWRLVAAAGDPIGDHTMTHPQMPSLSAAAQLAQIRDARTLVESIIGRPMLDVFRPPYGAYDEATVVAAAAAGFPTVLDWDTSDRDTSRSGTLAQRLAAAELGTDGSIVLMHCGPNATPYLLPDLIAYYRSRGFRLVTVPTLLGIAWDPGPTTVPDRATILDGLAPLPPTWEGGVIVGADGYVPPTPTTVPTPVPSASAAVAAASAPASASPIPSAASDAGMTGAAVGVGIAGLALAGLLAIAVARRRR